MKQLRYLSSHLSRIQLSAYLCIALSSLTLSSITAAAQESPQDRRFIQVQAKDKYDRTKLSNLGMSIEALTSDTVWGFATLRQLNKIRENGFNVLGNYEFEAGRGGHANLLDFPRDDARFHNYERLTQDLQALSKANPELVAVQSIGKSVQGRNIWAVHINSDTADLASGVSQKPGIIFMGNHHAREHLSLEVPFLLIRHLLDHKKDQAISELLNSRDIWVIPMVNPDGAEYDIEKGNYRWWRKNRRDNRDGTFGVDLNRNYSYKWGTGGSDDDTSSEVYMGPEPFSEPETQSIRDFVKSHLNTKILLSFHTFSELILYPWGHTYDPVSKKKDFDTYKKLAETMAQWNHYTPQQSSALYIASGDTTDWAYGEFGIFAFTFELSPKSSFSGGFYPGAKVIDRVFQANLQPCLYLIKMAEDPYQALNASRSTGNWLESLSPPLPTLGGHFLTSLKQ